jgi:DHA2 family multidrug resistance protein
VLTTLRHSGFSSRQALQFLENTVQSQSVMLSTNRLFLIASIVMLVSACGVWLMPKPKGPVQMPTEAG